MGYKYVTLDLQGFRSGSMNEVLMMKAIALLSGGLDSTLAAKIIKDEGIELEALNFLTVFCTCTNRGETCLASQKAVDSLGIGLRCSMSLKNI